MKDELLIATILVMVTIVFSSVSIIMNPNSNVCNDDYCQIDYYKRFLSDARFKV